MHTSTFKYTLGKNFNDSCIIGFKTKCSAASPRLLLRITLKFNLWLWIHNILEESFPSDGKYRLYLLYQASLVRKNNLIQVKSWTVRIYSLEPPRNQMPFLAFYNLNLIWHCQCKLSIFSLSLVLLSDFCRKGPALKFI